MAEFTCGDRERLRDIQDEEIIFLDNPGRWVLLPVEFPTIFKFYKALENQYWTPGPLIWDRDTLVKQISSDKPSFAQLYSLAVYCVLIDLKLYKGILACEDIDSEMYMDVLDQLCGITDYVQSPEARAFIGFQNMLEDFHREAINGSLAALLSDSSDATGAVASSICIPHVRHTWSKALWVNNHLNGLTLDSHSLPGDKSSQWQTQATSKPCLPEALIALIVSRCVFNASGVKLITTWTNSGSSANAGSSNASSTSGGGSSEALNKFLTHFQKDMHVFADFYAHLYSNLKHKLSQVCLFAMLGEALILEYQYLCTVFYNLIDAKLMSRPEVGSLVKAAVLRVVSACGESPSEFESFYATNEQSLVDSVVAICWPQLEAKRGTKHDNSSLPFVTFSEVPGDWLSAPQWPIISYNTTESGYHQATAGETKMELIPSNTTTASAVDTKPQSNLIRFDDDF